MSNKTALQELIEWYNSIPKDAAQKLFFIKATELLEKEKEQIMDAWETGELFGERVERDGMTTQQVRKARAEYLSTSFPQQSKNPQ